MKIYAVMIVAFKKVGDLNGQPLQKFQYDCTIDLFRDETHAEDVALSNFVRNFPDYEVLQPVQAKLLDKPALTRLVLNAED